MACGLELRAPFLDTRLFDVVRRVPASLRISPAKQLLREAVPELPEWVSGPKRCFQFPFAAWAEREWRPVFADADAASPVPAGTWYRRWSVLVLKHWIERMRVHGS
jgi:asparagine synthase (glutamine-hydrolysing)